MVTGGRAAARPSRGLASRRDGGEQGWHQGDTAKGPIPPSWRKSPSQEQVLQNTTELRFRAEEHQHPPPGPNISVYLIILLCTPGAGRLWKEALCYGMQEEAEEVLISRLAPGTAVLDTVCYLTSGPISGPGAPEAAAASWLFNLFSARMGTVLKREPWLARRALLITKHLSIRSCGVVQGRARCQAIWGL